MRRKDKKITREEIIQGILNTAEVCRVGFAAGNIPYIVPMNFAYHDNSLYIHSAPIGKKIESLKKNNTVCFEIEGTSTIVAGEKACNWSTRYRSVIGYGKIFIIDNREEKIRGLDILMKKFTGIDTHEYNGSSLEKMVILRIDIKEISGKQSGNWSD